jgi:flagellar hook protein FlgE
MSLFSTLSTAASGLGIAGTRLSVIGDNIANINTIGFKSARPQFADLVARDSMGLSGPSQIGTGGAVDTVSIQFGQGAITESENALDVAISGNGFYTVSDTSDDFDYYTRDGQFFVDDSGHIVNAGGYRVQGYNATDGTLTTIVDDLQIDSEALAQRASSKLEMAAILSADTDFSDTPISSGTFTLDGNTDTIDDAAQGADFATSVTIYDSLGTAHDATVLFERESATEWGWYAIVDGGEVGETEGMAFRISGGALTFGTDGELDTFTQTDVSAATPWNFTGADDLGIEFDFGVDTTGDENGGSLRAVSGPSAVSSVSQDGYGTGDLIQISVDQAGIIQGTYTNGEDLTLGQLVLADFPSYLGLKRTGHNLFQATTDSGDPAIGAPGSGPRGSLISFALEQSNVDLEDEFVDMIQSQRTYQANARVITTTDGTLQELVQLL